jgi:hypothetical protein
LQQLLLAASGTHSRCRRLSERSGGRGLSDFRRRPAQHARQNVIAVLADGRDIVADPGPGSRHAPWRVDALEFARNVGDLGKDAAFGKMRIA